MIEKKKYKLHLSYDGTFYGGWQKQPNKMTIQEILETAFEKIFLQHIVVTGSGRTDAGVHAKGQVAHIILDRTLKTPLKLQKSLNALLPSDIRILSIEAVPFSFHARFSAKSKIYSYTITTQPINPPFTRRYRYHYTYPLDMVLLRKATSYLIGEKNFKAFSNEAHRGSALVSPVKEIYSIDIQEDLLGFTLVFHGSGFLYKMVRNMTGTLLDIARKKLPLETLKNAFVNLDRSLLGNTAPPIGLILEKVFYDIVILNPDR